MPRRRLGERQSILKVLGTLGLAVLLRWLRSATRRKAEMFSMPTKRGDRQGSRREASPPPRAAPVGKASRAKPARVVPGPEAVLRLVKSRAEAEWVTARLRVLKVLADDREGARHQRLLVKVGEDGRGNDFTVKVSHNLELAPRVPISEGEEFIVRGEFAWNDLGGAIHWTHHDPDGRREGGWIEFGGRRYM